MSSRRTTRAASNDASNSNEPASRIPDTVDTGYAQDVIMLAIQTGAERIKDYCGNAEFAYVVSALIVFYWTAAMFLSLVVNLIGFAYPAYKSMKAMKPVEGSDDEEDDDDDEGELNVKLMRKWLIYWVVFAAFSCAEFFVDSWIMLFPAYYVFKVVFLLWCMTNAKNNGSTIIYKQILKPFFLKHEEQIDEHISEARDRVKEFIDRSRGRAGSQEERSTMQRATDASITLARTMRQTLRQGLASPPPSDERQNRAPSIVSNASVITPTSDV